MTLNDLQDDQVAKNVNNSLLEWPSRGCSRAVHFRGLSGESIII